MTRRLVAVVTLVVALFGTAMTTATADVNLDLWGPVTWAPSIPTRSV